MADAECRLTPRLVKRKTTDNASIVYFLILKLPEVMGALSAAALSERRLPGSHLSDEAPHATR